MSDRRKTAIIIGAGPAGLTAALELLRRTHIRPVVLEATGSVGGISRTVNCDGYRMDIGGHRFFSKSDWVMDWWQEILPVAGSPDELRNLEIAYQGGRRALSAEAQAHRSRVASRQRGMKRVCAPHEGFANSASCAVWSVEARRRRGGGGGRSRVESAIDA
jgi:monoamine oxidase